MEITLLNTGIKISITPGKNFARQNFHAVKIQNGDITTRHNFLRQHFLAAANFPGAKFVRTIQNM